LRDLEGDREMRKFEKGDVVIEICRNLED